MRLAGIFLALSLYDVGQRWFWRACQIDGQRMEAVSDFFGAPKSLWMVTAAMKLKDTCSLEEKL